MVYEQLETFLKYLMQAPALHIVHSIFYSFSKECYDHVLDRYGNEEKLLGRIARRVQVPETLKKYHCSHSDVSEEDPENNRIPVDENCLRVNILELEREINANVHREGYNIMNKVLQAGTVVCILLCNLLVFTE